MDECSWLDHAFNTPFIAVTQYYTLDYRHAKTMSKNSLYGHGPNFPTIRTRAGFEP